MMKISQEKYKGTRFLNSVLDLNGKLHSAATIGREKNALHLKNGRVRPRVGLDTV
jgi:hypothetical protein